MGRLEEIVEKVKQSQQIIGSYMRSDDVADVVLMYLYKGDEETARRIYGKCRGDVGSDIIARIPADSNKGRDIARMFYNAKDYLRAAQLFEKYGLFFDAADAYNKCGNYAKAAASYYNAESSELAAAMYEKDGQFDTAGQLYEQVGKKLEAARCYKRSGNFFESGYVYHEMGKEGKAVEMLQKIAPDDQNFLEASRIIVDIFKRKNHIDFSIKRYLHVVSVIPISENSMDIYYDLGIMMLESGQYNEAEKYLNTVAESSPDYRSVVKNLERINELKQTRGDGKKDIRVKTGYPDAISDHALQPADNPDLQSELNQSLVVSWMDGLDLLEKTYLFEDLTLDEMKLFWDLCETKIYETGENIITESDLGNSFFIIKRGYARITRRAGNKEEFIRILGPGEQLGEVSLTTGMPATASAVASEETEVFVITKEVFYKLLDSDDQLALKIYKAFVKAISGRLA